MPQEDFFIGQGDTAPVLQVTLKDSEGTGVDVTGATVKFSMVNRATGQQKVNEGTVTLVTEASGIVEYPWVAADTSRHGDFLGAFEVTYSDGTIETFPNNRANPLVIHIEPEIG